jgi:hypothetical protein
VAFASCNGVKPFIAKKHTILGDWLSSSESVMEVDRHHHYQNFFCEAKHGNKGQHRSASFSNQEWSSRG